MAHQGAEAILTFLQNPQNKPIRDLIELAANEDTEAVNYMEFIQEEIAKKFKSVDGDNNALQSAHLSMRVHPTEGQDAIRAIDEQRVYYFNEFGVLKNEQKVDNELSFEQYEKVQKELIYFMHHILIHNYKFKAKIIGNQAVAKKKKHKLTDYDFKTILFSPKFEQSDHIVILIPPERGAVTYSSLAIDEGLAYGTMLPYIEKILSWNPKGKKAAKNDEKAKEKPADKKATVQRRWGIMVLDPKGKDTNNNKYSIIKIFDKWLSKRIPSVGLFGGFHPSTAGGAAPTHRRKGSDESVASTLSAVGSGPHFKAEIKSLFFIGGLNNGELISHLLHRRGASVEKVIKCCIFLNSDDPYDANDVTQRIYSKRGVNYLNSTLPRDAVLEGKKVNGDPYIINRVSAGNPRYCCQSAFPSIIEFMNKALEETGDEQDTEEDEYKQND